MSEEISGIGRRVSDQDIKDLYESQHERLVFYGCTLSRGDIDLAEDLVSSMYQKLIQKHPILLRGSLKHYAFSTIRNNFLDYIKSPSRKRISLSYLSDVEMDEVEELSISPCETMPGEIDEMKKIIRRLVSDMPPSDREAFNLCIFEGKTYGEAMKITGRTRGALKMGVSRAYKSLVQNLSERGIKLEDRVRVDRAEKN